MERQRSFSFKPTRFLVFSFTICSSFIFLTFFTIWIIKATPLVRQPTHLQFNRSYPNLGPRPITVLTLTGFSRNFTKVDLKNPILIAQDLSRPWNSSGFGGISLIEGIQKKSEAVEDGGFKGDAFGGNFTEMQENVHKASPEKIEVPISGSKEEKKTRAGSLEKIEASTVDRTEEKKKIIATSSEKIEVLISKKIEQRKVKDCDLTKGSWVFDESYPLYTKNSCPFIDEGFDCDSNGRLDKNYMKWRWQPNDCDIPRFNATKMLELIKGKRLVFVGDSINRNQWESMLCMLMGAIRDPKRVYETHGRKITKEKGNYSFKFMDYQCTVEYYVSHFLVHESKARIGQKRKPTLRIDAIDHGSSRWRGADILIFNTAHWWSHYKTKAGVNYYQEGNQIHPQLNVSMAFRKALTTWASWVDKRINPRKTQIFFRSSAPSHFRGGQWNSGGHCMEAAHPLNKSFSSGYPEKNIITDEVIKQMKTRVTFLNITSLSEYRIDGHPSIFGRKSDKRQLSNNIQDCSHWCLPGVPDSWNELLYFNLLNRRE
ncbi:Protein trichome birefringence-like [Quillaja saponaria]|uniref:Protein trichome birefringence-like n=1 Tax=Quillaja saponaria TaxID=32244 RepID=A0AAD7VEY7_QUISA|nr:Protein trichome birefringence-like [Quillaja saponaria]